MDNTKYPYFIGGPGPPNPNIGGALSPPPFLLLCLWCWSNNMHVIPIRHVTPRLMYIVVFPATLLLLSCYIGGRGMGAGRALNPKLMNAWGHCPVEFYFKCNHANTPRQRELQRGNCSMWLQCCACVGDTESGDFHLVPPTHAPIIYFNVLRLCAKLHLPYSRYTVSLV